MPASEGKGDGESSHTAKKKKGKPMVNRFGSWNVDGQWAKGSKKIKYMETEDGMGLSRAKMRRESKIMLTQFATKSSLSFHLSLEFIIVSISVSHAADVQFQLIMSGFTLQKGNGSEITATFNPSPKRCILPASTRSPYLNPIHVYTQFSLMLEHSPLVFGCPILKYNYMK
jgi:hypothetical protein